MKCPNCEHGEMHRIVNERVLGSPFLRCNLCLVERDMPPEPTGPVCAVCGDKLGDVCTECFGPPAQFVEPPEPTPDAEDRYDRLKQTLEGLSKAICNALIFRDADEVEKFARQELNMVDRDEVEAIAVQELHMIPPREEDP